MKETPVEISAAEFKAKCLKLMDEIARTRRPLVITKPSTLMETDPLLLIRTDPASARCYAPNRLRSWLALTLVGSTWGGAIAPGELPACERGAGVTRQGLVEQHDQ